MLVMQLDKNNDAAELKVKETYAHIKDDLTEIVKAKEQLKLKLKVDTSDTSALIKNMERRRS